ncbi:MAG: FAD-linked oxidase C-terminal domain-containing protein [Pseudomonadota bacterium]
MITMPKPDLEQIKQRATIAAGLREHIGDPGRVIDDQISCKAYESDALTAYRTPPMLVVIPDTTAELSAVLRFCHQHGVKIVARGAGTSLSGGAHPLADGVLVQLGRLNQILDIDYDNRTVTVQPGVTNLAISKAVDGQGFYYAPDPSSQMACSIGGNVAENSGGVHCLKYGLTTNNILGLEVVLITGEIIRIGGKHLDSPGYDLMGIITGSEGLLGIVSEVTVKILKKPQTARAMLLGFDDEVQAGNCVARIIANGIIPAAMEMMDKPAIHAVESYIQAGYPLEVEALLIIELDGADDEVTAEIEAIRALAHSCGARHDSLSQNEQEREQFWAGRKAAFSACGTLAPDFLVMDGTIPRARLPEVLGRIRELSTQYQLRVVNVFHAGDGNLHPLILYDANSHDQLERAEAFGADILRLCVEVGGVLSGEHGIGIEKRDLMGTMFSEVELNQQQRIKCAFDPSQLLNPGKVFPHLHRCAELGKLHVHHGKMPHPDLPRF